MTQAPINKTNAPAKAQKWHEVILSLLKNNFGFFIVFFATILIGTIFCTITSKVLTEDKLELASCSQPYSDCLKNSWKSFDKEKAENKDKLTPNFGSVKDYQEKKPRYIWAISFALAASTAVILSIYSLYLVCRQNVWLAVGAFAVVYISSIFLNNTEERLFNLILAPLSSAPAWTELTGQLGSLKKFYLSLTFATVFFVIIAGATITAGMTTQPEDLEKIKQKAASLSRLVVASAAVLLLSVATVNAYGDWAASLAYGDLHREIKALNDAASLRWGATLTILLLTLYLFSAAVLDYYAPPGQADKLGVLSSYWQQIWRLLATGLPLAAGINWAEIFKAVSTP